MVDEPDNLVLRYLRRIDEKLDVLQGEVVDLKNRMSLVERQVGIFADQYAGLSLRIDRVDIRLERIERRLDLVEV